MDISNFDLPISRQNAQAGSPVRDILAELRYWMRGIIRRQGQRRQAIGAAIDDHLLRDIGLNRLGIEQADIANHNEAR